MTKNPLRGRPRAGCSFPETRFRSLLTRTGSLDGVTLRDDGVRTRVSASATDAQCLPTARPRRQEPNNRTHHCEKTASTQTSLENRTTAPRILALENEGGRGQPWPSRVPKPPASASEGQRIGFPYCSALITSMPTNGSSPSTQASWPGGMVYDIPFSMVV